jgi:hypothetical protein
MKKTNTIIIALMIIGLLMLAGCTETPSGPKNPYIGGNEALTIEFQPQRPPDTVYSAEVIEGELTPGNSFSVGVSLKNLGEEAIFYNDEDSYENKYPDFGRITLKGINPEYYGITQDNTIIDFEEEGISLRANKRYLEDAPTSQGGMQNVQFETMSYQYQSQGFNDLKFTVDLCYNYKTQSTTNICVVTDSTKRSNKICNPYETKTASNSGGPVHVNSILQAPAGRDKISMIIEIEQKNLEGVVFAPIEGSPGNEELVCDEAETNSDKNKIFVEVYLPDGNEDISCTDFKGDNSGIIMLNEGVPTIIVCDLNTLDVTQDYTTQLSVDLEYAYGQYIDTLVSLSTR